MTIIREDVQNRIAFLEGEVARLGAQITCFHQKIEGTERDIERKQAELEGLRFGAGLDGASPGVPPRTKVLVQPEALKALTAQPMAEEALIAHLGVSRRAVHNWIVRALREGKIRRSERGLEVIDPQSIS